MKKSCGLVISLFKTYSIEMPAEIVNIDKQSYSIHRIIKYGMYVYTYIHTNTIEYYANFTKN